MDDKASAIEKQIVVIKNWAELVKGALHDPENRRLADSTRDQIIASLRRLAELTHGAA